MSNLASKTLQNSAIFEQNDASPVKFKLAVITKDEVRRCRHWAQAFRDERKDRRYYELVEDTIHPEFDYRYFVVQDENGEMRAAQPFFLLDQDMLAGTSGWMLRWADGIRRWWPGFMKLRTMMVGCAAGEGHLDGTSEVPRPVLTQILAAGIADHARQLKARMIVLKEFPAADREALECFVDHGYTRLPSMPMTEVGIKYAGFDEYMLKVLSRNTRAKLRKKFRTIEGKSLEMSVSRDITPIIDEVYPLYLNVYEKAKLKFEKLSKEFFCRIGREMPDKVRFFYWRHENKIVAFGMCMVNDASICSEYVGFDYDVAFDLNLYYVVIRDIMAWAMANGYTSYRSTGLNYEPKFHLRYQLDPLDLYVRHTSPVFNLGLKYILPLVEPTRYDAMLKRFANYKELWPAERGGRVQTSP
jgi:predicted N-acyltransferase